MKCNICNKEVTDYTEHLWMKHIHNHEPAQAKPAKNKPVKGVQSLAAGITCLIIAFIIGFVGISVQTGGLGEGMFGGIMIIIAAILGLVGIGKLIYGGILAGARQ